MRKKIFAVLAILAVMGGFSLSQGAFTEKKAFARELLQTIDSVITDVNVDERWITVKWLADSSSFEYQDITLSVPKDAVIVKGSDRLELDELAADDHVTIRFDANAEPLPKVVNITVFE